MYQSEDARDALLVGDDSTSLSEAVPALIGDLDRALTSFLDERRELRLPPSPERTNDRPSSSTSDVATVVIELVRERVKRDTLLFPVVAEDAYADARLATDVFTRLWVLIDPPNISGRAAAARAWNRFREIASNPNMAALVRVVVLGVDGMELFPFLNVNRPYWWTESIRISLGLPPSKCEAPY